MHIPSLEDTKQPEPHIEVNSPLEPTKHPEETGKQLPVDQGGEDLEIPHRQKKATDKGNNKIKKLK